MAGSGAGHKICSVVLRTWELICAIIVIGILSRFCYLISIVQVEANGRIIYAMVVAGIGIVYSFFFCLPFKALFLGFPFDFIMFVMWLVAYCLLQTQSGTSTCSSNWYYNYWGYYWGSYWRVGPVGRVHVTGVGCGYWRTVLAFSFMAWFAHFLSGILGLYVFHHYIKIKETTRGIKRQAEKLTRGHSPDQGFDERGINQHPDQRNDPVPQATV